MTNPNSLLSKAHLPTIAAVATVFWSASIAAQSNVVMYGLADSGLFSHNAKINGVKTTTSGLASGEQTASRLGFRGKEVLTPNLNVKFELEGGLNISEGTYLNNGRAFGRAAWVGLESRWGELRLGRQPNATSDFFVASASPFGNSFTQAGIGRSGFRASNVVYQDQVIKYLSPRFQAFDFSTSYSFKTKGEEQTSRNENTRAYSLTGRYESDWLTLVTTYDRVLPANSDANANGRKPSALQVGGNMHFSPMRFYAAWTTQKDGWIKLSDGPASGSNSLGADGYFDGKVDAWLLGAQYMRENQALFGTIQNVKPSASAFTDGQTVKVFSLGYTYNLSRRTNLYALASYLNGDLYTFKPDSYSRRVSGGILHRF